MYTNLYRDTVYEMMLGTAWVCAMRRGSGGLCATAHACITVRRSNLILQTKLPRGSHVLGQLRTYQVKKKSD